MYVKAGFMIAGLAVACVALSVVSERALAAVEYKILTGAESGTYYAIGRDLAKRLPVGRTRHGNRYR